MNNTPETVRTSDAHPGSANKPTPLAVVGRTNFNLNRRRESLSENFNNELDAWARKAMGANGFGG